MEPLKVSSLFTQHSDYATSESDSKKTTLASKIAYIAKNILIAVVGLALFATNTTVFAIGFISGIVADKATEKMIARIKTFWNQLPWAALVVTGIGAFFALEVTMAASTFLFAANLGSKVYQHAESMEKGVDPGQFNFI